MPRRQSAISVLVLAFVCIGFAEAQRTRNLLVSVVDSHFDPSRPLAHVRLSLGHLRGNSVVTEGIRPTNDQGQVLLRVEGNAGEIDTVQISVIPSDAPGLVIYEPAGGILETLQKPVTLKLLPKGSPALLGPAQIEALLYAYSQKSTKLLAQNRQLLSRLSTAEQHLEDLTEAQQQWGLQNGFDLTTVKARTNVWADSILGQKGRTTNKKLKLAALAKGRIDEYIRLSQQGQEQARTSLQKDSASLETAFEKVHAHLRDLLEECRSEALGQNLESHPHLATQVIRRAAQEAETLHETYPKDASIREIWIDAALDAAAAKQKEGEVTGPKASPVLLAESASDYQVILNQLTEIPEDRKLWIRAQNDLGNTLLAEGLRARGREAQRLFTQSAEAYHRALDRIVQTEMPQDWATAEHHLGDALQIEGERIDGDLSVKLIAQSVECYQLALKVRTQNETPQEWGLTQTNLGTALRKQAERIAGPESQQLLKQAVQAHIHALDVRIKTEHPREWARTQSDLGLAYLDIGERDKGPEAVKLLAKASEVLQESLDQTSQEDVPQAWADKQMSLGLVYVAQAERTGGQESTDSLTKAVEAFHNALKVDTETELPQGWASTQSGLGIALRMQGERSGPSGAAGLFEQSVGAFHNALEVFTDDGLPQDWANTQIDLSTAYVDEAEQAGSRQPDQLLSAAEDACRNALKVFTKADLPQGWARAQACLGDALLNESRLTSGMDSQNLIAAAVESYRDAIEVYTEEDFPYAREVVMSKLSKVKNTVRVMYTSPAHVRVDGTKIGFISAMPVA